MSSVSCLLFNPVGRLVFHNLVIFRLLVHHIHLLVLLFLSLLEYTVLKIISIRRWRGRKINQCTEGEGHVVESDEANEGDSPIEVGC